VTGHHGAAAMLSVDQLPAGYSSSAMTAVHGATWPGSTYPCAAGTEKARSRSPPYPVSRGGGPLPSPDGATTAAGLSFVVGRVPTSSAGVYHVDTGRSYTPLHCANLAIGVDADNSSYCRHYEAASRAPSAKIRLFTDVSWSLCVCLLNTTAFYFAVQF